MDKEYGSGEDSDVDDDATDGSDEAPELITSREDFTSMMDDFLTNYEFLGRKMKHKLEGESGAEKLNTLRRAMGHDERIRLEVDGESDVDGVKKSIEVEVKGARWDCETILSTLLSCVIFVQD